MWKYERLIDFSPVYNSTRATFVYFFFFFFSLWSKSVHSPVFLLNRELNWPVGNFFSRISSIRMDINLTGEHLFLYIYCICRIKTVSETIPSILLLFCQYYFRCNIATILTNETQNSWSSEKKTRRGGGHRARSKICIAKTGPHQNIYCHSNAEKMSTCMSALMRSVTLLS